MCGWRGGGRVGCGKGREEVEHQRSEGIRRKERVGDGWERRLKVEEERGSVKQGEDKGGGSARKRREWWREVEVWWEWRGEWRE